MQISNVLAHLSADEAFKLTKELHNLRGSYAVQYMLRALMSKTQTHTLQSAIDLIDQGRQEAYNKTYSKKK